MDAQVVLTGVCCAMVVGLGGWLLLHSVDRRVHPEGRLMVSEEVFLAKLAGWRPAERGKSPW